MPKGVALPSIQQAALPSVGRRPQRCEILSSTCQGQFSGMPCSLIGQRKYSPSTTSRRVAFAGAHDSSGLGRLTRPGADLGPIRIAVTRACHLERVASPQPPNWPYGRLPRSNLSWSLETTVGAPLGRLGFVRKVTRQIIALRVANRERFFLLLLGYGIHAWTTSSPDDSLVVGTPVGIRANSRRASNSW
jgi:hypothetical protein